MIELVLIILGAVLLLVRFLAWLERPPTRPGPPDVPIDWGDDTDDTGDTNDDFSTL